MTNPVLESASFINSISEHVSVDIENVKKLAKKLSKEFEQKTYSIKTWKTHPLHPSEMNPQSAMWIFVIDTLNFSLYEPFSIDYNGKRYTGYWALCAAVNRALDNGIDLLDANVLKNISDEQIKQIFASQTGGIPQPERRRINLQEAGKVLLEKFEGSVEKLIRSANGDCLQFLSTIVSNFSSYNDIAQIKNRTVSIFKRAQILIADLWACFEGNGLGSFHNIDLLTSFADYRVPQSLRFFGLLQYDTALSQMHLENNGSIEKGSIYEVEIRGNTVWAIELLKEQIIAFLGEKKIQQNDIIINPILIDFYLWDYAKKNKEQISKIPIHFCDTWFY
ncbi:queuosine salvage protein [Anaeramoeba flamelloides]|uniref:Queuosine 5'-phosphate N-glycosylase/hydrolase n=1 Tax=Anaeramoeba flamelloides TaxID=1746091 RepID=A0ABQ8X4E9_9EUKA|nr:queuosine salvage protein [Anaeramoeba flamelloides]